MSKERYNEIIDEVYENYHQENKHVMYLTFLLKEEFINKIKTNQKFSEKWGLKIEERELSWEERVQWVMKNTDVEWENLYIVEEINKESSPTKLITLTYNGEKIEFHE